MNPAIDNAGNVDAFIASIQITPSDSFKEHMDHLREKQMAEVQMLPNVEEKNANCAAAGSEGEKL